MTYPKPDASVRDETSQTCYRSDDSEISLVELAAILASRWKAMAIIFSAVMFMALLYVINKSPTYTYTSVYMSAEQAPVDSMSSDSTIEPLEAIIEKAKSLYVIPVTLSLLEDNEVKSLPFNVSFSGPANTGILKITSVATEKNADLVQSMHENLLTRIATDQEELLDKKGASLATRLSGLEKALSEAKNGTSETSRQLIASYVDQIAIIEGRIDRLQSGHVKNVAVKSLESSGTSSTLILMMAMVLGVVLSLVGGVLIHFASLVRSFIKARG